MVFMQSLIQKVDQRYKKAAVVDVRSGDSVRVHQKVIEGGKSRVQIFEGLVIRTDRKKSATSSITVRRIASGVGVEKSFLLHSPNVAKIQVTKRSKVRRNYLSYMRARTGKSARLESQDFDKKQVNEVPEEPSQAKEEVKENNSQEEPSNQAISKDKIDEPPAEASEKPEVKEEAKE